MGQAVAAAGLLAVLALTLQPVDDTLAGPVVKGWCLICGDVGLSDFILNAALFLPIGLGLRLAGVSWRSTIAICAALTLAIELAQMSVVTGRDASAGDLAANTAGGIGGGLLGSQWRQFLFPSPAAARALAWMSAAAASTVVALSALALRPSVPDVELWGQIAPQLARFSNFEGSVSSAMLGGAPVPPSRLPDSRRARRAILSNAAFMEAVVVPAGPTREIAPIARIVDGDGREVFMLGQSGRALVFRLRRVGSDARVATPAFAIANVFPPQPPDGPAPSPVRIAASWSTDHIRLAASGASAPREREIVVHALLGWRLLYPFTYDIARDFRLASIAWLAALLLPVAWWCRRATPDESWMMAWLPLFAASLFAGVIVANVSVRAAMLLVPASVLAAVMVAAAARALPGILREPRG